MLLIPFSLFARLIENEESPCSQFFHQQFWSSVKLFGNILRWRGILSDKLVKEMTLDSILNRYIFMGLQFMRIDASETIEKVEFIVRLMPQEWLLKNDDSQPMTTPQLANTIKFIIRSADTISRSESTSSSSHQQIK